MKPVSRKVSEEQRIRSAMARIAAWESDPSLMPAQVVRLTGLSRMRVWHLIDTGVFGLTRDREISLKSIRQWYAGRIAKITPCDEPPIESR
jgi:predicted DNA-binding transcriptional regulator AlpA